MQILIQPDGAVRCLYAEAIDLKSLGKLSIQRASHVEPDDNGHWIADLSPVHGPALGPFSHRSEALATEAEWLEANWLTPE